MYLVKKVPADVTAESAMAARENALAQAQEKAFYILLNRIALPPAGGEFPVLTAEEIINFVKELRIENEKRSKVRYIASVSVLFNEQMIKEFLQKNELSFIPSPSKPILILPAFQDENEQSPLLFNDRNVWFSFWKNTPPDSPVVPLVVPLGDLEDMKILSPEMLSRPYDIDIKPLLEKYKASEAFVFKAVYHNDKKLLDIEVYPFLHAKTDLTEFSFLESVNVPFQKIMKQSAEKIVLQLEEFYRSKNALRFDAPSSFIAVLPLEGLADWMQMRGRLDKISAIKQYILQAVKKDKAQIEVFYAGNLKMLSDNLKEEGLFLFPQNGDFWIIKKMENATEEELSRDPFLEVDTQEEYFTTENEPWEENVLNEGRQQSDARENSDEETLPLGMPKNSLPENTSAFTENKTSEEENQGWTGLPSFLRRKEEESGLPPAPETINTPPPLPLF